MYQIGEIIGYFAVAGSLVLYLGKSRDSMSIAKIVVEVILLISTLFCELYLLAVLGVMAIIRQAIFHFRGKKAWAESKFWLYFFIAFSIASPIIQFAIEGFETVTTQEILLCLLPTVGSVLNAFGYFAKKSLHVRLLITPAVFLYGIYYIIIWYVPSVIGFGLSVISLIIGFIKESKAHKENKVQQTEIERVAQQ